MFKGMMQRIGLLLLLLLINFSSLTAQNSSVIGKEVNDFSLRKTNGQFVALHDYADAKGFIIVFTCNHCPFAKLYTKRLNGLHGQFAEKGVPVLAINAMDSVQYEAETFTHMQEKAKQEKYKFPYLQDATQMVGKLFGAQHTPQAFVIWKTKNGKYQIRYSGAIDDNGENPRKAIPYIANAVAQLLEGKEVSTPETPSFGCRIFYRKLP